MKILSRRIRTILILPFIAVALLACEEGALPPGAGYMETPQPGYVAAQSTLDYGQSQMEQLSHQATVIALNVGQAANAAAQTTLDYNQRQMMELAYQATEISLNIARAAATQQFITGQTQMAGDALATAESQAATANYSAYILSVTQTAQAQAILDVRATETARAIAAMTAIPLTMTPLAATQAAILFEQRKYERQSNWGELVTPLIIILATLVILLLILGGVLAFRRFMPALEFRLRNPHGNGNLNPVFMLDGMSVDLDPDHRRFTLREPGDIYLPQLPGNGPVPVEIISPTEPTVARWITEAEQELGIEP